MDRIFLDSSVFVKHCMEGDELLRKLILEGYELAASPNVMEESFYRCLYLRTEVLLGKSGIRDLRANFTKNPDQYEVIFSYYKSFLGALVESGHCLLLYSQLVSTMFVRDREKNLCQKPSLSGITSLNMVHTR